MDLTSAPTPEPAPYDVVAVVPVKLLGHAKTRLALPAAQRRALALAFALDTVAALLASPAVSGVLVVTSDPVVAVHLRQQPVRLVPDEGVGLGQAVRCGVRAASRWAPSAAVVVVPADLPCLRGADVTRVLASARGSGGAFVPDRSSTGTTLLWRPPGGADLAHYGPGSAARHRAVGLRALADAPLRARLDVDTVQDLREALALGTGARTAAAVLDGDPGRTGTVA